MLIVGLALLVVLTAARVAASWQSGAHLTFVTGVWMALADDLGHGVLYRPLSGPAGYGGTRFLPLHFALQAGLTRIVGNAVGGGFVVTAAAGAALLAGVFILMRRLGTPVRTAAAVTLLLLAGGAVQEAFLTIRGDLLAAALNVWGVACCARAVPRQRHLAVAALCFTLALASKMTTVFGLAAAGLLFLVSGRKRQAGVLVALTLTGCAIVLGVVQAASGGQALAVLRACASGGATAGTVLRGPVRALDWAMREDPGAFLILSLALVAFVDGGGRRRSMPWLLFLTTGVVTALIFGSPGTAANHLLDLHVSAAVLLGSWTEGQEARLRRLGVLAGAVAAGLALYPQWSRFRTVDSRPHLKTLREVGAAVGRSEKPMLSEDPMVPLTAGERPYLVDPYLFRVLRARDQRFAEPLWEALDRRAFSAVVFLNDPRTAAGRQALSNVNFGPGFCEAVEKTYSPGPTIGRYVVFFPRE